MKKIAFMGSDPIAIPLLNYLLKNQETFDFQLKGIISQPDKPSGRGKKVAPNLISQWGLDQNLFLLRPDKPTKLEYEWVSKEKIDLVLVMAYGHIIRKDFLQLPPLGMLNFHASLLPKYRGASPIETAIARGDNKTGVTLMEMVSKMDAGGILDQEEVLIDYADNSASIRDKISKACIPLIRRNLLKIFNNDMIFAPQNDKRATYARKIFKDDGWIDFNLSAAEIYNRSRAFSTWPGSFFEYNDVVIKVGTCEALDEPDDHEPGILIDVNSSGLLVSTSDGILRIKSLQRPGGKMMSFTDFLRGFEIPTGSRLVGKDSIPLVSIKPFQYNR